MNDEAPVLNPVIVIATFNELANLRDLIPALRQAAPEARVVIVDDNSPDGTPAFLENLAKTDDRIVPLVRPGKQGYGTAVLQGFRKALDLGAETIITLDADFSHDPVDVLKVARGLAYADIAIGSRYVGGVRVLNWGPSRLLLSLFANRYVKVILGLPAEDATSGYRAYRRTAMEALLNTEIKSVGYSFLVEILYRLFCQGFRIAEVPIIYTERREGQSKMSRKVIFEAIFRPWLLRLTTRRG